MGCDPEQPGHRARGLGERLGGSEGLRWLSEAVEAYRQALTSANATTCPRTGPGPRTTWALRSGPGQSVGGPEGLRRLSEAVEAHHQALTVHTRDDLPQHWAWTQDNLGNALASLGERQGVRRVCGG